MRSPILVAMFAACIAIQPPAEALAAAPSPYPQQVIIAGGRLLALDAEHRVWARALPLNDQLPWELIAGPKNATGLLACAPDGSGNCAVGLRSGRNSEIGFLPATAKQIIPAGIEASDLFGFADGSTLYFGRKQPDGQTAVYVYDVSHKTGRPVGRLAANETATMIVLNGGMTLVARARDGLVHTFQRPGIVLAKNLPTDAVPTRNGMIVVDDWDRAWDGVPQRQQVRLVQLGLDEGGSMSEQATSLASFPVTYPVIDQGSLVSDFEGDLFATETAPDARSIVAFCNGSNGKLYAGKLASINRGGFVRLVASPAGNGTLVIETEPGHAPHISIIQFRERSPKGFRTRSCDAKFVFKDTGISSPAAAPSWSVSHGSVKADDGTPLTYLLLRPHDRPVEHLLIETYGAYGSVENSNSVSPQALDHLLSQNTALAYVTVRGDGNAGIAAAMSSRSPNRQVAVDDLVTVTKQITKELPPLKTLPTVEGKSAGAWLAMDAALQHPELYAGAIGYSGAYLFADNPRIASEGRFFAPSDSFDRNGVLERARCSDQRFRIIHADDDPVIGVAQARSFMQMLKEHGCHGEFLTFSSGGHGIDLSRGSPLNQTLINAYFSALNPTPVAPSQSALARQ